MSITSSQVKSTPRDASGSDCIALHTLSQRLDLRRVRWIVVAPGVVARALLIVRDGLRLAPSARVRHAHPLLVERPSVGRRRDRDVARHRGAADLVDGRP